MFNGAKYKYFSLTKTVVLVPVVTVLSPLEMRVQWLAVATHSVSENIGESAGPVVCCSNSRSRLSRLNGVTLRICVSVGSLWRIDGSSLFVSHGLHKRKVVFAVSGLAFLMIEVVQTALITYELFRSFATNFEDVAAFSDPQVSWFTVPIFSGIVTSIVQIYFAHRISVLSGSRTIGLIVLATTQGSLSIVAGAQARTVGDVSHLQEKTDIGTTMWQAGSTLCDVMIAISMTYFLSRFGTKYKETRVIISRFIRLVIETGSMTATVAVTDLILYLVFPHSNFHIAPALVLAKPYSNTLLVMLNSRMHVSTARDDSTIARHSRWPTLNFIQPTQGTSSQVEDVRGIMSDDLHTSDRLDHRSRDSSPSHRYRAWTNRQCFLCFDEN
ncbi:hypothetical protein EDD18DRAFT_233894 [Armillaria luteobubalina]|uniref:DUF6534 domain-containing protein n=1 Tax=Armillaria luteobubalina TaxID=153913 RepID=A0AA39TNU7_9AGAR|nr:hypothetical protein EDD18DRAFT_233894 [Armillaria luteobubalina]